MSIFDQTGRHPTLTEGTRALDLFTDRGELLRLFCRRLHADLPEERILFFYGAGGNGKSLLLRYLARAGVAGWRGAGDAGSLAGASHAPQAPGAEECRRR